MIKNIIFDIGNVLVRCDWRSYLKNFGFPPEEEKAIMKGMFQSPQWGEVDRDILSQEEQEALFIANVPQYKEDVVRVFRELADSIHRYDYAIPWIEELRRQGFRVYYLSNYPEALRNQTADALDFIPYMDGGVFSYEVHLIKPEPAIFQALLARYPQIRPEESVFLDDIAGNVEAAAELNFHSILFKNREQADRALGHLIRACAEENL